MSIFRSAAAICKRCYATATLAEAASSSPHPTVPELPKSLQTVPVYPKQRGVHVGTLTLASYTENLDALQFFADFSRRAAYSLGIHCSGPVPLPIRTNLITVPKSPFIYKKSQENFWRRHHKRALRVYDADKETVDRWLEYLRVNSMGGIGMKAQLFEYHEPGFAKEWVKEDEKLLADQASQVQTLAKQLQGQMENDTPKEQEAPAA